MKPFKGELNIYSIEEYIEKQSTQEKSSSNPCGTITFDDVNTDPTGNTNTGSSYYDCIISIIPHHVCPYGGTDHDPSACGPNGTGPGAPYYTVEWDCTLSNAQKTNTKSKSSSSCGGGSTSNPTTPVGINEPTIETCDDADCKCPTGFIKDINTNECVEYDHIFNELTGKEKCLNDSLTKSGNNYIKNILKKFQGDKTEFDINIKSKDKNHIIKLDLNKSNGLNIDIKELSKKIPLNEAPATEAAIDVILKNPNEKNPEKILNQDEKNNIAIKTNEKINLKTLKDEDKQYFYTTNTKGDFYFKTAVDLFKKNNIPVAVEYERGHDHEYCRYTSKSVDLPEDLIHFISDEAKEAQLSALSRVREKKNKFSASVNKDSVNKTYEKQPLKNETPSRSKLLPNPIPMYVAGAKFTDDGVEIINSDDDRKKHDQFNKLMESPVFKPKFPTEKIMGMLSLSFNIAKSIERHERIMSIQKDNDDALSPKLKDIYRGYSDGVKLLKRELKKRRIKVDFSNDKAEFAASSNYGQGYPGDEFIKNHYKSFRPVDSSAFINYSEKEKLSLNFVKNHLQAENKQRLEEKNKLSNSVNRGR